MAPSLILSRSFSSPQNLTISGIDSSPMGMFSISSRFFVFVIIFLIAKAYNKVLWENFKQFLREAAVCAECYIGMLTHYNRALVHVGEEDDVGGVCFISCFETTQIMYERFFLFCHNFYVCLIVVQIFLLPVLDVLPYILHALVVTRQFLALDRPFGSPLHGVSYELAGLSLIHI